MTRKYAPSIADIEALAYDARMRLPPAFVEKALEVGIRVENMPSAGLLAEMEIVDPFELTAVYEGIPLTQKCSAGRSLMNGRRGVMYRWPNWWRISSCTNSPIISGGRMMISLRLIAGGNDQVASTGHFCSRSRSPARISSASTSRSISASLFT